MSKCSEFSTTNNSCLSVPIVHAVPVQIGGLHPEIKEGEKINVSGMIDPLGKDRSQWNVTPAERQALEGYTIFIRPASITPARS